ncbi:retrovirus-related pol polyprotein from transposon TNT 1-94 [Tanacetum coccineum]
MENANPPPTNNPPVLPTALHAQVVHKLNKLQEISTYIDSRLENINQFLNGFTQQPNEIDVDDLEPDNESVDTPLVSPFLDSNDDSDDGEVVNELEEYGSFTYITDFVVLDDIGEFILRDMAEVVMGKYPAHLEKKWTRLQLYTKIEGELCKQCVQKGLGFFAKGSGYPRRGVTHNTSVSRPQLRNTQMKDEVVQNNSQVMHKKMEVEEHRTVRLENDQFAPLLGYGDLVQGNFTIKRVYYIEGLNYNIFSVGQFCDADFEVAFKKSTCFVRDLQGNDLLTDTHGSDLYTIALHESSYPTPICFMSKASMTQAWLWYHRLLHLNIDSINLFSRNDIVNGLLKFKYVKDHLCSSCELGKAKHSNFKTKTVPSSKGRLYLLHMDLCGPMCVESINGKKYILMIVDDYSRYTWTHFMRSKDETLDVLINCIRMIQQDEGIHHQTKIVQTPERNGIVERRNRTLVEATQIMLSAAKLPLFFWAEAIATACYTQNCSLIIPRHEKTPYHIINDRKPTLKLLHIFGCTCYIVRDGENLDKMKEKGDPCIFVGYAT